MRCTNDVKIIKNNRKKKAARFLCVIMSVLMAVTLSGCGDGGFELPYEADAEISSYNVIFKEKPGVAQSFASDLCVVTEDVLTEDVDTSRSGSAILFDPGTLEVLYAKNAHLQLHPASLTKIMTALVALKYGSADQILTATDEVKINESGAVLLGLEHGDTMTLSQALHVLLIRSANDVAMLIAENIGGTVDDFVNLMNQEAKVLGATNTHFLNPHGLTQEGHYTTAYDLYLIFNEAIQYDLFQEIIHMTEYQTTYHDSEGNDKKVSVMNSNRFLQQHFEAPAQVTVIGGKTGTTNAAGHCLTLLSRDIAGAPYISIIMRAEENDILYQEMIDLLDEINK